MWSTILGWLGEKTTTFGLWLNLDEKTYHRIDNVIIPARDGTAQVDHVLVSVYGIFVIETKNMKGWIFGVENQATWTQSIFGKKHQFQNPLHQNYRHTKCLAEYLGISHNLIHSVVFFIGEALKTGESFLEVQLQATRHILANNSTAKQMGYDHDDKGRWVHLD